MNDPQRATTLLRRRIAGALFARQWLVLAAIACIVSGVALLLAKQLRIDAPRWPIAIVLLIVSAIAAWRTRRQIPSRAKVIALLDAHSRAGGLLMAQDAVDVGAWTTSVDAIPRVAWRAKRQTILTTICAAFLLIAAIAPARVDGAQHKLAIGEDVAKLEARIDLLKEENVLPEERAESMKSELDELQREAAGDDPSKAWETLDTIDEATLRSASEAAGEAVAKAEQLTKTEATALALSDGGLSADAITNAMNDPETQKAIGETKLSAEQLRALGAKAAAEKAQLRASMQKLSNASLIDPKTLRDFDAASAMGNRQDLARFLKEHFNGALGDAINQWCRGAKGGVDRGRGDAPMEFGDETEGGAKFNEQTLPSATAASLAQSEVLAVSAAAPNGEVGARSQSGALQNAQAGGGSALTPTIQPRHRGTVQRFFERKSQ